MKGFAGQVCIILLGGGGIEVIEVVSKMIDVKLAHWQKICNLTWGKVLTDVQFYCFLWVLEGHHQIFLVSNDSNETMTTC